MVFYLVAETETMKINFSTRWRWKNAALLASVTVTVLNLWIFLLYNNAFSGPMEQDNKELISYIKAKVLKKPSEEDYNLLGANNLALRSVERSEEFYVKYIRRFFQNKTKGFFVEAGALDGETMSLSLWLEKERGWNGLLVEPDEISFWHLSRKNRKAWSANVCLSPTPYPVQLNFLEEQSARTIYLLYYGIKPRAMNRLLMQDNKLPDSSRFWVSRAQCFPLTSLLLALSIEVVDLLILDVEEVEKDILENFDFDRFNVQVIFLEWKLIFDNSLIEFLKSKKYILAENFHEDSVFVKSGSEYENLIYKT